MQHPFPETILVTGANGQLGSELKELSLQFPEYRFLFATRKDLQIDSRKSILEYFEATQIHYCINCAAYTAVDKAEAEREYAFLVNGTAVGELALICKDHQAKLIHISTDYVYDGSMKKPLKETDAVSPLSVYGWSKLRGEELALAHNPASLIIRTSWVFSSYGNNFVKTMLRLLVEKKELNIVADQIGCPTYAADLASAIMLFIRQMSAGKEFSGIYNFSNYGITSWFQFAQFIRETAGSTCTLQPVTSEQYLTAATRPKYSVLDTSKIQHDLNPAIPFWKDSVTRCIEKILQG